MKNKKFCSKTYKIICLSKPLTFFWKCLKSLLFSILNIFKINKFEIEVDNKTFRALWTLSVKDSVYLDILHSTK